MVLLSIILIAFSLSMDTFSLALGIGLSNSKIKKIFECSIMVGIYHIIMAFFGHIIGSSIFKRFSINSNLIMCIILLVLAISFIINYFKNEDVKYVPSFVGLNIFALSVSIDSFSVGIGLLENNFLYYCIFGITSFLFTFLGFKLGYFLNKKFGKIANIIGIILLVLLSLTYFIKI